MSTYKNNIIKIIDNQMKKGKENYGHTLEEKPLSIIESITNAQEELVDSLFYLENLKETLKNKDVLYCDTDSINSLKLEKLWEHYDKAVNIEKNWFWRNGRL